MTSDLTVEAMRYDAKIAEHALSGELTECPQCHHDTLVVTGYWPATLIDPSCSTGYCTCQESEMLSVCCGAPEHPDVEDFCSACNEGTGFERECSCKYRFG